MKAKSLTTLRSDFNGAIELKLRSDVHTARRFYHVVGIFIMLFIYNSVSRPVSLGILSFYLVTLGVLDYLRLRIPRLNQTAINWFRPVLRSSELNGLSGMTYLMLGTWICVFLFPPMVVNLSLLLLCIGDPASSVVGILYGKDKIVGEKTLQGTMACFVSCTVVALVYYHTHRLMPDRLVLASILTGLVAALSELLPVGKLDDNFSFPVIASMALWVLFYLFGAFA